MKGLMNLAGAKALRKNSRKGFTLVEIIVVIVIIAILLAALTPAVIGWINEARDRAEMAEARSVLIAVQAVITEGIGNNADDSITDAAGGTGTEGANAVVGYKGGRTTALYASLISDATISDAEKLDSVTYTSAGELTELTYIATRNEWKWTNRDGNGDPVPGYWTPKPISS